LLFSDYEAQRVLEIGCGEGALFAELGFDRAHYRGVDFSPAMLRVFKSRFPNADLVTADGSTYKDEEKYDLIFSNGVAQYLDLEMLERHLSLARRMLAPRGRLIMGSVLWKERRGEYCAGNYDESVRTSESVRRHLRVLCGMKVLGAWYNPREVEALGRRHGFAVEIFGSMVCLYRFHAVLQCLEQ
jgi:cyclopropane fatty-acyl-phospholipid synthase-like methyltransferase